jgi:hypothetical protein
MKERKKKEGRRSAKIKMFRQHGKKREFAKLYIIEKL